MSRMTKFLKQTCQVEKAIRDNSGIVSLSTYGDILYGAAQTVPCRRERYVVDLQANNGAIVKAQTRYFFDETLEILVDDKVDGHVILHCEEYIDQHGACIGYEVYV